MLRDTEAEYFEMDLDNDGFSDYTNIIGNLNTGLEVEIDKASKKLATALTPDSYKEIVIFRQVHLLHKPHPPNLSPEQLFQPMPRGPLMNLEKYNYHALLHSDIYPVFYCQHFI